MSGILIHLMRHGPPLRPGLLLGHTDDPACPAAGPCPVLPGGLAIRAMAASDLRRAQTMARALAAARGVPLAIDPRWRELNFGAWDGLAPEAVDPAALARFHDDPDACPPPGGESWSALRGRVAEALHELDDAALVITHAGAMRAAVSVLTGLDHHGVWAIDLPYGALLSLRVWKATAPNGAMAGQIAGLRGRATT